MRVRGLVLVPLVIVLLAGCSTGGPVGATIAPVESASASAAPDATPTTPPPTQDAAAATPVQKKCSALVPAATVQALLPDLAIERGWTPVDPDRTARLEVLNGTTCRWSDAAGDFLEVGVAKPSADDAVALKNDMVERSQSVPTFGGEAYFQVLDHDGEVDAFRGRTWIMARSNRFFEPGDAVPVVAAIDAGLGLSRTASPAPTTTDGLATPVPTATPAG